jgi:hypothetical protein
MAWPRDAPRLTDRSRAVPRRARRVQRRSRRCHGPNSRRHAAPSDPADVAAPWCAVPTRSDVGRARSAVRRARSAPDHARSHSITVHVRGESMPCCLAFNSLHTRLADLLADSAALSARTGRPPKDSTDERVIPGCLPADASGLPARRVRRLVDPTVVHTAREGRRSGHSDLQKMHATPLDNSRGGSRRTATVRDVRADMSPVAAPLPRRRRTLHPAIGALRAKREVAPGVRARSTPSVARLPAEFTHPSRWRVTPRGVRAHLRPDSSSPLLSPHAVSPSAGPLSAGTAPFAALYSFRTHRATRGDVGAAVWLSPSDATDGGAT